MGEEFEALGTLDQEMLMSRMANELPQIRKALKLEAEEFAGKVGMDVKKLLQIETGEQTMKWSEFMSILFLIWNNEIGRNLLETKGLFPKELKKAMSINRNAHPPVTG